MIALAACTHTASSINSADDALNELRTSAHFKHIRERVGQPDDIRIMLESSDTTAYDFWIYEDRDTHAATIERVRIDHQGRLFVYDIVDDTWKLTGSAP
ncbi:MAG: hypothetical protein GC162_20510 [Planctomycetes bacterium]|nr:hypothetical protein [Planctomycetota bacterium]